MKTNLQLFPRALAILIASSAAAAAASFTEDFNAGTLNTNLTASSSTGFSFAILDGRGQVMKQAGVGNGDVYVTTSFAACGNFTVSVRVGRSALDSVTPAALGLLMQSTHGWTEGYADIFFNGSTQIVAKVAIGSAYDFHSVAQSASDTTFQIRRVATTLYLEYAVGLGFQTLATVTDTNVTLPLNVSLFLSEQFPATMARSGWFDNLAITAGRFFTPIPGFGATNGLAAVLVGWPSVMNNLYQAEYRPVITPASWVALGPPVTGTGSAMALTNWVVGEPLRFYRVGQFSAPVAGFAATVAPAASLVSWPSVTNNHYQVEYRSALTSGAWVPLGQPLPGTGSTMSVTNWLVGQPECSYRVIEQP